MEYSEENPIWSQENTAAAFDNPQVGDHFSEMMCAHVFVVDRSGDRIVWCSAVAPCSFPSDGTFKDGTIAEFKKAFAYKTGSTRYYVRLTRRDVNVCGWLPIEWMDDSDGEIAPFGLLPNTV